MSAIFISHSSRDDAVAAEVRKRLRAAGHRSVFLDFDPADGIPAGRSWEQELYARLRACGAVIVLCSEHSMTSDWVFAEITHARALGKPVFPMRVGRCSVRSILTDLQVIDLTAGADEGYARLWRGLRLAGLDPRGLYDWDGSRPPYPGLLAFEERDAAVFFGRDAEIAEGLGLLRRVRRFGGSGWVLVLGASGSGKSSLVRAGLLPRLRRDPDAWLPVGPMRPLDRPFEQLAEALAAAFAARGEERSATSLLAALLPAPGQPRPAALVGLAGELRRAAGTPEAAVLLVVDQLEEALAGEAGNAGPFLALLRGALETPRAPLTLLATLRSDYLGEFQGHPALRDLAFASLSVGPLSMEDFARVVEGPAERAGLELEPGLVQALVRDAETDDALPLLAFTLRELWEGYGGDGRLAVDDYRHRLGGLHGSVARAAETALGQSASRGDEEAALRTAFLSMVRVDAEGSYTRQPARWSDLPAASHGVLERFVAARLLTSRGDGDERRLEVAHEALLRVWDRLVGWLDDDRAFLLWRKRLGETREAWRRAGRRAGYLLRGPALGEAAGWLDRRRDLLRPGERRFIRAGRRAERRRRYRLVAVLAVVALTLALLAVRAETERRRAERSVDNAIDSTKLIASRRFRQLAAGIPFMAPTLLDRSARTLVELEHPLLHVIDIEETPAAILGMSPDLMVVAMRGDDGVAVRAVLDGRWSVSLPHPAAVRAAVVEGSPPAGPLGLRIAPRGRHVLTAAADGVVRLWELPRVQPLIDAILERRAPGAVDALVGAGGASRRVGPPVEFAGHGGPVRRLAFSDDGRWALSLSDAEVAVWRTGSGAEPPTLRGHRGDLTWAAFSPDGRHLVTTATDRRALVWTLSDLFAAPLALEGHAAALVGAAFSADSRRLVTVAGDRELRQWSLAGGEGAVVGEVDCDPVEASYAGTTGHAIVGCRDGTARVVDLGSGATERFE